MKLTKERNKLIFEFEEIDKIIEKLSKIRSDPDELRVLKQRPSMLGDLINFALKQDGEKE